MDALGTTTYPTALLSPRPLTNLQEWTPTMDMMTETTSMPMMTGPEEKVNHPIHYGGDTTYETIKVIEAWDLNFNMGNAVKYISRAERKYNKREDLEKAIWYLQRELGKLSQP